MRSTLLPVAKRGPAVRAARLLALVGCAALLAGCYQTSAPVVTPAASDYRLRHPIAIKEGARTVELFIGSNRGGLTGEQCADVLAFATTWRRQATGGWWIERAAQARATRSPPPILLHEGLLDPCGCRRSAACRGGAALISEPRPSGQAATYSIRLRPTPALAAPGPDSADLRSRATTRIQY